MAVEIIERGVLLPFSAENMYNLVNDLKSYPSFVPACESVQVEIESDDIVLGTMLFVKAGFKYSLTTRNTLAKNKKINMDLVKGPFSHLKGTWNFLALDESACKVELILEYRFDNSVLESLFTPMVDKITDKVIDVFTMRAFALYKK